VVRVTWRRLEQEPAEVAADLRAVSAAGAADRRGGALSQALG
jgi:hypothetical protein